MAGEIRPWTDVCECWRKVTKVGSTATVSRTVNWSYPILPFGIALAHFFPTNFLEIAVLVEISHLESPVSFYFVFMVNVKMNWRAVFLSTPGLHGSGQIFERTIFFLPVQSVYTEPFRFLYRLQYSLHVKSQKLARVSCKRKVDSCKFCPFKHFSGPVLTGSQTGRFILFCIQLFRERLSEKVHATIPKGIVGGFEFTFLQRNSKEWHLRPWTYICEC